MRRALILFLTLFLGVTGVTATAADQTPLTRRERKDRVAKLPDKHRQFLADVDPIIIPTERDAFLRLETSAQRDTFIQDFWHRRDIARGTTNSAARSEYYAGLEFVKDNFGNAASDRGRIYLVHGP